MYMSRVCAVGSRTPRLAPARGLSWDAADVRLAGCRERCMGQCMDVMLCYCYGEWIRSGGRRIRRMRAGRAAIGGGASTRVSLRASCRNTPGRPEGARARRRPSTARRLSTHARHLMEDYGALARYYLPSRRSARYATIGLVAVGAYCFYEWIQSWREDDGGDEAKEKPSSPSARPSFDVTDELWIYSFSKLGLY